MTVADAKPTSRPIAVACVMLSTFMIAIEATIVATAAPAIVGRLGGFELYSWVFASFLLTQSATTVIFGKLSDIHGRRPVLIGGILLFLAASVLCGLAQSMPQLVLFRLLQGLGAGAIQPVTMTLIGDLYPGVKRASVQGYLASVWAISAVVGPTAGGIIVERFDWAWVFWVNLPIGVVAVAGFWLAVHERIEARAQRIDYPGAALFFLSVAALVVLLTQHGGLGSPLVAGSLVLLVIGPPLFVWQQRRAPEPMLPLTLLTDRLLASANTVALFSGMTMMGVTTLMPIYVQMVLGRSALVAGFALSALALGWPIAATLIRHSFRWIGPTGAARLGGALVLTGCLILLGLGPTGSPVLAGFGAFVMGLGLGSQNSPLIMLVQDRTDWSQRGSATAAFIFSRVLGNTVGAAALGGVLNLMLGGSGIDLSGLGHGLDQGARAGGGLGLPTPLIALLAPALHVAFWCVAGTGAATFLATLAIPRRTLRSAAAD